MLKVRKDLDSSNFIRTFASRKQSNSAELVKRKDLSYDKRRKNRGIKEVI